jgi:hypothetical protein
MRVRTVFAAIALAATATLGGATSAAADVGDGSSGVSVTASEMLSGLVPMNLQGLTGSLGLDCLPALGNVPCSAG